MEKLIGKKSLGKVRPEHSEGRIFSKGTSEMWWIIATAIIVLLVVIIVLIFFKGGADKLFGGVNTQISALGDCDKDTVGDIADNCPCVAGLAEYSGCPSSEPTAKDKIKKSDTVCTCK